MPSTLALVLTLALLAGSGEPDPRVPLVESQIAGKTRAALEQAQAFAATHPEKASELWLGYLEGDLLERLGRLREANRVFGRLLSEDSLLAAYGRFRMATVQETLGHPEVAAGLVATLLGTDAPPDLVPQATDLLVRALNRGADCRLLGRLDAWRIPDLQRRSLNLAVAECSLRAKDPAGATTILIELLMQETADAVGRRAAELLSPLESPATAKPEVQIAIGLAFHHNREFRRAAERLERGLADLDPEHLVIAPRALAEYRYATARAYFWLRDYATASTLFREIATAAGRGETAARAYYQEARCHELAGNWKEAAATFRKAYLADNNGEWSAAALFSALRLEFRGGREAGALEIFALLDSRPGWTDMARRAALFLTASDVERGRADRAAIWLRRSPGQEAVEEFLYWSARLAELQASPHLAIRNYIEILKRDPHHPLAAAATDRLRGQASLSPLLEPIAQQLAASGRRSDLHAAWLLLGEQSTAGQATRQSLQDLLRTDRRAQIFLDLRVVPPAQWPLWHATLTQPGERLLALGLWDDGEAFMGRFFPFAEPSLAFSAGVLLGKAGRSRNALYVAEVLAEAIPAWLPGELLPRAFRQQLYPFPFRSPIEQYAAEYGVDSNLLAGLIREESRFDPLAVSVAAARGLTQFVYPTALEVAAAIDLDLEDPSQLHQPEIAIALGSSYLAQLLGRFDGRTDVAVTAYNAGADQARLWRSYCYSNSAAEFYSKVGFAQTRSYLRKVLSSRSQYEALYGQGSRVAS